MIRRLLLLAVVSLGSFIGLAGTAHADGGYIACAYERDPLHAGLCVSMPQL